MSDFDDLYVDASAFQPMDKWQARASDLLVWLLVFVLLLGGWFFRDGMLSQFRYLAVDENATAIPYPAQWRPQPSSQAMLQALDPDGESPFPAREVVAALDSSPEESAASWPQMRQRELEGYHEEQRESVTLRDGQQAMLLTYTYVADVDDEALPMVVVRAQDLVFIDDGQNQVVVVTLAADAREWDGVSPLFQRILQQMGVAASAIAPPDTHSLPD